MGHVYVSNLVDKRLISTVNTASSKCMPLNWPKFEVIIHPLGVLQMGTRVFIGGLTSRVRERDIEKFFRKYGRIKEVAMKSGFAFVVRTIFFFFFCKSILFKTIASDIFH